MFRSSSKNSKKRHESHADDISVYEPTKFLGIFAIEEVDVRSRKGAQLAKIYESAGAIDSTAEPFIDLHLRPTHLSDAGAHAVRDSLRMVGDYIAAHPDKLAGQEVVGITYLRLGQLATYFGFEATTIDGNRLPESLAAKITQDAAEHGYVSAVVEAHGESFKYAPSPRFPEFAALHQNADDIVRRFASDDTQ